MNAPADLNGLAGLYRWMEYATFGPWLAWCRSEYLGELGGCRRALVLGDGDGRFTARLLRANPHVEVDAVDASTAMLRALVCRAGPHAGRVRAFCADIRLWEPVNAPYDLIVTHFFLDFLTIDEVRALAGRLRGAVSPSVRWVVSEFFVPQGWYGRVVAAPVVAGLYFGFGRLTGLAVRSLPDHPGALRAAGFGLGKRRERLGGLLASEIWTAM
jgi:SAM-dependent methyltransferase